MASKGGPSSNRSSEDQIDTWNGVPNRALKTVGEDVVVPVTTGFSSDDDEEDISLGSDEFEDKPVCEECEETPASLSCPDCELIYCKVCSDSVHVSGLAGHVVATLEADGSSVAAMSVALVGDQDDKSNGDGKNTDANAEEKAALEKKEEEEVWNRVNMLRARKATGRSKRPSRAQEKAEQKAKERAASERIFKLKARKAAREAVQQAEMREKIRRVQARREFAEKERAAKGSAQPETSSKTEEDAARDRVARLKAKKAQKGAVKKRSERKSRISMAEEAQVCDECEVEAATLSCPECELVYCATCRDIVHSGGNLAAHTLVPLMDEHTRRAKAIEAKVKETRARERGSVDCESTSQQEKAEKEIAETENGKKEKEKAERKKAEKEKAEKEKAERETAEKKRAEMEKAEKEKAEQEKAEKEKAEKEKAEKEKAEKEKAEKKKAEKKKAEKEKAEKEQAEKEVVEKEKKAEEKAEKEKAEKAGELAEKEQPKMEKAMRDSTDRKTAGKEDAERKRLVVPTVVKADKELENVDTSEKAVTMDVGKENPLGEETCACTSGTCSSTTCPCRAAKRSCGRSCVSCSSACTNGNQSKPPKPFKPPKPVRASVGGKPAPVKPPKPTRKTKKEEARTSRALLDSELEALFKLDEKLAAEVAEEESLSRPSDVANVTQSEVEICEDCEVSPATLVCEACELVYCQECSTELHATGLLATHLVEPLDKEFATVKKVELSNSAPRSSMLGRSTRIKNNARDNAISHDKADSYILDEEGNARIITGPPPLPQFDDDAPEHEAPEETQDAVTHVVCEAETPKENLVHDDGLDEMKGTGEEASGGVLKMPELDIPQKHLNQWVRIYNEKPDPDKLSHSQHEGFMLKQGFNALGRSKFNERYFLLHEQFLYYWDVKKSDMRATFRGCVSLQKCVIEEIGTLGKQRFCFSLTPLLCGKPGKSIGKEVNKLYVLATHTEEAYHDWLKAIRKAATPRDPDLVYDHADLQERTKIALNAEKYTFKLLDAIKIGDEKRMLYILRGLDIDSATEDGWRAVHMAAFSGKVDTLRFICNSGADLNARTAKAETPLYLCFVAKQVECAVVLLEAGADPIGFDSPSATPIDLEDVRRKRVALERSFSLGRELWTPFGCIPFVPQGNHVIEQPPDTEFLQFMPRTDERERPAVKAASVPALFDWAIDSKDVIMTEEVLLSLDQFSTPGWLLVHLQSRLIDGDRQTHSRIGRFLMMWIKCFFEDFFDPKAEGGKGALNADGLTLKQMFEGKTDFQAHIKQLEEQAQLARASRIGKDHLLHSFSMAQLDILEPNMPRMLAEQVTVYEADMYLKIRPKELIGQKFSKDNGSRAVNVVNFIDHFNKMSAWVEMSILKQSQLKDRVATINAFLEMAWYLRDFNNFNAQMWLISALQSTPIFKLKKTWEAVRSKSAHSMVVLECFKKMQDPAGNYKNMARLMERAVPPAVPFLGMYLTQLTFADDGGEKKKDTKFLKDGLVSFKKHALSASIVKQALYFQAFVYPNVERDEKLTSFFQNVFPWDEQKRRDASAEIVASGT